MLLKAFVGDAAAEGRIPAVSTGLQDLEECANAIRKCAKELTFSLNQTEHVNASHWSVAEIVRVLVKSAIDEGLSCEISRISALRYASHELSLVARSLSNHANFVKNSWWLQPRVPSGSPEGGQWTDGRSAGGAARLQIGSIGGHSVPSGVRPRARSERQLRIVGGMRLRMIAATPNFYGDQSLLHQIAAPIKDPKDRVAVKLFTDNVKSLIRLRGIEKLAEIALDSLKELNEQSLQIPQISSFFDPAAPLEQLKLSPEYEEFSSHARLARKYPPKPGYEIHHPVPQHSRNIYRFGRLNEKGEWEAPAIHNTDNAFYVPALKHWLMHGLMNIKPRFGMSPMEYLLSKDFEEQRRIGIEMMEMFGISED